MSESGDKERCRGCDLDGSEPVGPIERGYCQSCWDHIDDVTGGWQW